MNKTFASCAACLAVIVAVATAQTPPAAVSDQFYAAIRSNDHTQVETPWGSQADFDNPQVRDYFLDSVAYWMEEFHIDGLRVDAVASMLYLDYSRKAGEWIPNQYGGRENLEAVEFLKQLNMLTHGRIAGS